MLKHFTLISLLFACSCMQMTSKKLSIQKGIADLRELDLDKQTIFLDGEWEFYWQEHIPPSGFVVPAEVQYIKVPGNWNGYIYKGKKIGGVGYGSYRLKLIVPDEGQLYSLKLKDAASAFTLYINGNKITSEGKAERTEEDFIPEYYPHTKIIGELKGSNEIVVHVSNFAHFKGGLWEPIEFGKVELIAKARDEAVSFNLFLGGCIFIMGVYHVGLYLLRQKDLTPLYFSLFCFIITTRIFFVGERFALYIAKGFPWELSLRIQYFTYYSGPPVFLIFIRSIFPNYFSRRMILIFSGISLLFFSLSLVTKPVFFTSLNKIFDINILFVSLYLIINTIRASFKKQKGANAVLFGIISIVISVIHDILYSEMIISSIHIIPAGLLIFIFTQAYILASRFSASFSQVEKLSAELSESNQTLKVLTDNLEGIVKQRTSEIENLSDLTRKNYSTQDIDSILYDISEYLENTFGVEITILYLFDNEKNELYPINFKLPGNFPASAFQTIRNTRVPMDADSGTLKRSFLKNKILFLKNIPYESRNSYDRLFLNTLQANSFLLVPIQSNDLHEGTFLCANYSKPLKLSKEDLKSITRFSYQISGVISNYRNMQELEQAKALAVKEKEIAQKLLLNILPEKAAAELMEKGEVEPQNYESITVLFTDFKGFTKVASKLLPSKLLSELDGCFSQFDDVIERCGMEKLKTIGDSYMCAGGIPVVNNTHAIDACLAALEIQAFMEKIKEIKTSLKQPYWELRIGIHTGPVIAGVIGKKKFSYDIWGDTVNIASRMESAGEPGKINISEETFNMVKLYFNADYRGEIPLKNKKATKMYFLTGLKPEYSIRGEGLVQNDQFHAIYKSLTEGISIGKA